jgi:L-fuconolactonase
MPGIVDAHVHVWDPARLSYGWLADVGLNSPHLPSDVDDAGGAVGAWVFVEADADPGSGLDEARWASQLSWPGLAGIVAAVELAEPDASARIAVVAEVPIVRGIRCSVQSLEPGELDTDALRAGLTAVLEAGLTFDACVRAPQLGELDALLARVPPGRVVLDHIGKPPVDEGLASRAGRAWQRALAAVAARPHVYAKLSGLRGESGGTETFRRHAPDFLRAAVDAFGPDRLMLGSDWPLSTGPVTGVSMGEWIETVAAVADAGWSRIAAGTAREFYRLP